MPMIQIGKWEPDKMQIGSGALLTARNTIPRRSGYDSVPSLISADVGSLNGLCRGAMTGRAAGGINFTVAGSSNRLYVGTTGSLANVSLGGGSPYTVGTNQWWDFALHGSRIIATNYTDAMESFVVGTSTNFAALSADSPKAKHLAVIRGFLFAGNLIGRGVNAAAIGTDENAVQWSAIDDPTSWPQVGTAAASAVQSDFQSLAGDGGAITDIVGGSDFGLIFRDRSIWRADYEGGDTFFRFTPVSENIGCSIPKGAIRIGGITYFPSEEGFYATNGIDVVPIGNDVVDRTFLADIQADTGYRVSRAQIPEWKCIGWLYMGSGASAEVCNSLLLCNIVDDMWSLCMVSAEWLIDVMPFSDSLDSYTAAGVMDSGALAAVNLDSLLSESIRKAGAFLSSTHALGTFRGSSGIAVFQTADFEPAPNKVATVRSVRPVFDGFTGSAFVTQLGTRNVPTQASSFGVASSADSTGKCNFHETGRYLRAGFVIIGTFSGFNGFDVDLRIGGPR